MQRSLLRDLKEKGKFDKLRTPEKEQPILSQELQTPSPSPGKILFRDLMKKGLPPRRVPSQRIHRLGRKKAFLLCGASSFRIVRVPLGTRPSRTCGKKSLCLARVRRWFLMRARDLELAWALMRARDLEMTARDFQKSRLELASFLLKGSRVSFRIPMAHPSRTQNTRGWVELSGPAPLSI